MGGGWRRIQEGEVRMRPEEEEESQRRLEKDGEDFRKAARLEKDGESRIKPEEAG